MDGSRYFVFAVVQKELQIVTFLSPFQILGEFEEKVNLNEHLMVYDDGLKLEGAVLFFGDGALLA